MTSFSPFWNSNSNIVLGEDVSRNVAAQYIVKQAVEKKSDIFIVMENANSVFGTFLNEHGYTVILYDMAGLDIPMRPLFRSKINKSRTAILFSGNPTTQSQARDKVEQVIYNTFEQAKKNGKDNCASLTLILDSFAGPIPYNNLMTYVSESAEAEIYLFLMESSIEKISKSYGTILKSNMLKNSNMLYAGPQTDIKAVDEIIRKTRTQINRYEHSGGIKGFIWKLLNRTPIWAEYQEETTLKNLSEKSIFFFALDDNKIEIPQVQTMQTLND